VQKLGITPMLRRWSLMPCAYVGARSVQPEVTLDAFEAPTEFVDCGLEGPGLLEVTTCTRGGERMVDDDRKWNDPLRAVHAGDHLGGNAPTAIPGAQGGARNARSVHRLLEGDPALFDGMAGKVAEKAIPAVPVIRFASRHRAITTLAGTDWRTLLSDRGLTW
jgi:hypothetical protein